MDVYCVHKIQKLIIDYPRVRSVRANAKQPARKSYKPAPVAESATEHASDLSLSERAYRVLHERIVRLELLPDTKLKIANLQERHQFSSSPLREALNRLVQEGLVRADDRRGFFVAEISIPDLQEIARLRTMLDSEALAESMRRGSDDWEARIVSAFHRLQLLEERFGTGAVRLDDIWTRRHKEFHAALLSGCDSPKLLGLSSSLFDQAERYRRISAQYRSEPRNKSASHRRLMDAVLARDSGPALALLRDHIEFTVRNVESALREHMAARPAAARARRKASA
jgi:DNA-binding GntR family transcriptional regulator